MARAGRIQDEDARESRRKRIKTIMNGVTAICVVGAVAFAASNLERTPITRRWRVISGNFEEDLVEHRPYSDQLLEPHKDQLLAQDDPLYIRVHEVVCRLLDAACDEQQLELLGVPSTDHISKNASKVSWRLAVVNRSDVVNACVTADGTIMFFTGLLPLLADEQNGNQFTIQIFACHP
jgi:hypothetical protein